MLQVPRPLVLAVVNDFSVVTAGVAALLEPYGRLVEVEQFAGSLPPRGRCDVVLLDIFGHPNPLGRLREVLAATGAGVVVFGWVEDHEQIDAAMRHGAAGFLSKTVDGKEIVVAVEAAAAGNPVDRSTQEVDSEGMVAWPGQREGLTPRESEVLTLIVAGLSNHDIANRSYLSVNTVKTYIRSAYQKMGVTSRSQAVLWGIEHGFHIEHPPRSPVEL